MKKFLCILALLVGVNFVAANAFDVKFVQPNDSTMVLNFSFPEEVVLRDVELNGVDYQAVISNIATVTKLKGWAELPFVSASVQLPAQKNVSLRIVRAEYHDIALSLDRKSVV